MRLHIAAYDSMGRVDWHVTYTDETAKPPTRGRVCGGSFVPTDGDDPDQVLLELCHQVWQGAVELITR